MKKGCTTAAARLSTQVCSAVTENWWLTLLLWHFQQSVSAFSELARQDFCLFIFISKKKTNKCITRLKLIGWIFFFFFFPGENATFSLTNSSKSSLCFREWDRGRQKESFHWNMFYVAGFFSLRNIWHQYRLAEPRHTVLHCTAAISKLTNSTHSAAIEARRFIPPPPPPFFFARWRVMG